MIARRAMLVLTAALSVAAFEFPAPRASAQSYGVSLPPGRASLVRTLLNGVSARRRLEAAQALGETGDPRVIEALATAAAHDTEPEVRRAAKVAIRQIRGDQVQPPPNYGPFPPPRRQDPNAVLVDSWYQRYLGRSVDAGGLGTFTTMLARGSSADEVQATILASGEFWDNTGGTAAGFVVGLYRAVLNRDPNRNEVGGWGRRYNLARGDRKRVAQEFLEAAQRELLQNQGHGQWYPN